jgi:hypothetical protein
LKGFKSQCHAGAKDEGRRRPGVECAAYVVCGA